MLAGVTGSYSEKVSFAGSALNLKSQRSNKTKNFKTCCIHLGGAQTVEASSQEESGIWTISFTVSFVVVCVLCAAKLEPT